MKPETNYQDRKSHKSKTYSVTGTINISDNSEKCIHQKYTSIRYQLCFTYLEMGGTERT